MMLFNVSTKKSKPIIDWMFIGDISSNVMLLTAASTLYIYFALMSKNLHINSSACSNSINLSDPVLEAQLNAEITPIMVESFVMWLVLLSLIKAQKALGLDEKSILVQIEYGIAVMWSVHLVEEHIAHIPVIDCANAYVDENEEVCKYYFLSRI